MALWLDHRTLNRENQVSNHLAAVSKLGQFRLLNVASVRSAVNEYLAAQTVMDIHERRNCSVAEFFPERSSWRWYEQVFELMKCEAF